jgi:acyl phosphate:glycerol-3-phosphate acyltransferase
VNLLLAPVAGYLIGGLPTGILLCRAIKGVDPRSIGSGSSGATNVSRVLGKKWALFVLLIDALKGFLPVRFLAPLLAPQHLALAGVLLTVGVIAGHVWTPYASFRGGKGVATAAGALLALEPFAVLIALAVWILVFLPLRYVSLASLCGALALAVSMWLLPHCPLEYRLIALVIAAFIFYTHRANIGRLLRHEENAFR